MHDALSPQASRLRSHSFCSAWSLSCVAVFRLSA